MSVERSSSSFGLSVSCFRRWSVAAATRSHRNEAASDGRMRHRPRGAGRGWWWKAVGCHTASLMPRTTDTTGVLELLHQQPLRADRVERLQQKRTQQPLGRDRGAADPGIEVTKAPREPHQCLVHDHPDRPQWMCSRHPILKIHLAEQRTDGPSDPRILPPAASIDSPQSAKAGGSINTLLAHCARSRL